ncbi:PREDICTED: uncharacterized protein LOC108978156 [Bactrocera latifrons]|uniref:uncharacterized protein LOC108978156 n=1 Tax=Bactrocera latifrons TaxID=174628 RepID=UPI0008DDB83E|nr:PREDICTED: uncharacterized protein LOC108978156 [Bactrocera latifrons]XP_018803844.1 PREDICTED: uncharacterized protein LOC108978156 [Bactrocera latifrons]XP_018803845.1 PREDICTED: uncharacterized protein LOC108978156 [Bactrocera latifrons]XP_018803846.1 PREDICTED: uncharacterized protein LOC108978156 [Bactrocera latifrons]
MTATMAAKDTNQLTRTNANITGTSTTSLHPIRRQPFYPQPSARVNTISATTTAVQTMMGRAINIGFAGYTHAHTETQHAGDGGIMHERAHQQRNEVSAPTRVAACVDIGVVDDDGDIVDSNGNAYTRRDSVAATAAAAAAAVGDVNFPVDTRTGVTTGGIMLDAVDVDVEVDDDDESDSFGSMETLSDNVAVWVDGEKHWVAGVDASTTCADLIGALLNYQNAQQLQEKHYQQQQQPQQHMFSVNSGKSNNNKNSTSKSAANPAINQSTLIKTSTHTKENCDPSFAASGELTIGSCLPIAAAVSMALTVPASSGGAPLCGNRLTNATEYVIVKQHRHCEEYLDGNAKVFDVMPVQDGPSKKECELLLRRLTAVNSNGNGNSNNGTFSALPNALHRASSPSLNLNTQVSSLLSTDKDSGMGSPVGSSRSARLRRRKYKSAATVSWLAQANTLHPRVSQRAVAAFSGLGNALTNAQVSKGGGKHIAVIDCGMGEEDDVTADALDGLGVGVDGGEGGVSANERLLKIILAQDETIHRQLALLREKERQISKIEEEKHRVRERELGKNYLLETYLNGLDEAHAEPDLEACTDVALADSPLNEFNDVRVADTSLVHYGDGVAAGAADGVGRDDDADVEIYIDESYQRTARTIGAHTTVAGVTTTTVTNKDTGISKARDFHSNARHSKKLKGDFGGDGGAGGAATGGKIETNKQAIGNCEDNETDVAAQLVWLEKIYALNKKLQREEEMLLKLHAKIRKHQVKRAYQTKREVLQQIEKLDAELTLQCCDIRAVESKLHTSNEQLKQKLGVLERLSQEFLQTMETPTAEAGLHADAADVTVAVVSQMAANRMPDVINNDGHNLATVLPATEVASAKELRVADVSLHAAKQTTEQLAAQESCQLQQSDGTQEAVWHLQDENMDLPQTMHATAAHANKIKELSELTQTNTTAMTTAQIQSAAENEIATTTNTSVLRHATTLISKLTATSCTPSSSTLSSATQTPAVTTATTPSDTTTHAQSTNKAAVSACNMPAMSPADEKQTTALHLLQPQHLQQQQQQQRAQRKQLPAAAAEDGNNSQQCVAADDLLVDALAAVGGVALPQSNYPISCINQAAIHATSALPTQPSVVAAANFTTPEQALPTAAALLPAAYLTSSATHSAGNITSCQQQQQVLLVAQPQLLPQRQYLSYMNASCLSNDNDSGDVSSNNKNLLPPSHAAHTKTLQKQMFGPKSLNQRAPPKTAAWTTPTAPMTTPTLVGAHNGFSMPSILAPLRPTTPTALSAAPVVPPVVDITQLGTLV